MPANPKKVYGDRKPPIGLMPLAALIHGTLAFYDGKGKYGRANWRENHVEAQTYVEAILRHVLLFANGEDYARDTGVHNLGGVIASASLLLDAMANDCLIDNRVKSQAACDLLHSAEQDIQRLNAQHAAIRAAREADADAQQAVEGHKRSQAAEALDRYVALRHEYREGGETSYRADAARDVLLNMVNGVFPEEPVDTYADEVEQEHPLVVRTSTIHRRGIETFEEMMHRRNDEGGGP